MPGADRASANTVMLSDLTILPESQLTPVRTRDPAGIVGRDKIHLYALARLARQYADDATEWPICARLVLSVLGWRDANIRLTSGIGVERLADASAGIADG